MRLIWKYLKPQKWIVILSLALAGISQLLNLVDPLIFGKIIDEYAVFPGDRTENELVRGVLFWLGLAVAVALVARIARSFQDYFTRLAVQKFGVGIFTALVSAMSYSDIKPQSQMQLMRYPSRYSRAKL